MDAVAVVSKASPSLKASARFYERKQEVMGKSKAEITVLEIIDSCVDKGNKVVAFWIENCERAQAEAEKKDHKAGWLAKDLEKAEAKIKESKELEETLRTELKREENTNKKNELNLAIENRKAKRIIVLLEKKLATKDKAILRMADKLGK